VTYETLVLDRPADHVARVTLSRPDAANAISSRMLDELADVVHLVDTDDDVRVWILTGAPRSDGRPWFSAGVDMREATAGPVERRTDPVALLQRIDDSLTPSIAAIDGVCTTGALELVLACDLRIAARTARLSDWHLKVSGLGIGAWGMAPRLSRLVGVDKAKELLLLSAEVDGEEAARIGLVNRVVDDAGAEALEIATTIGGYPRRGVRTTLGYLQLQAGMSKHEAMRWADLAPEFMGLQLRPFEDAANRFFGHKDAPPAAG
jgi:enoyl-CoA hydratase